MNVLSHMLDKAAARKQIGYHPRCQSILLTHLCFADDLMVFTDGTKRSIEGVLKIFKEFAAMSGLKISLEKSTIYTAGISENQKVDILTSFPFATGHLPVRYLGLPLLTKKMTISDYMPLVEKIKKMMKSWTWRFLSHAGRLQLISSVITSMANFWMSAFRLPSSCLKEIESLCSAFLWSGPEMKTSKAKVCWKDVCLPKQEGGLGLRPLKEVNIVLCLKLIWRLSSHRSSLWVRWIHCYLIRKSSFWSIRNNSVAGSWMWKKLLKMRDIAKLNHKMEVNNGKHTAFWYDNWSQLGCLETYLRSGGNIDLGIRENVCMADVFAQHRRRRHRAQILNQIEDEIEAYRRNNNQEDDDVALWRQDENKYSKKFSTRKTWLNIRSSQSEYAWSKGTWFTHSTPKYSFFIWVASKNRLQTMDRIKVWNNAVDDVCVLCQEAQETCQHLFFRCRYSRKIWRELVGGVMVDAFTTDWFEILDVISHPRQGHTESFIIRYVFQLLAHSIWRERNARKHGEQRMDEGTLSKLVDKQVRLKLLLVKGKGKRYLEEGLMKWFETRG